MLKCGMVEKEIGRAAGAEFDKGIGLDACRAVSWGAGGRNPGRASTAIFRGSCDGARD